MAELPDDMIVFSSDFGASVAEVYARMGDPIV